MSAKITTEAAAEGPKQRKPMFNLARKVLLASVGAMALAQDEIEEFVDKLTERGEIAEMDGRKLVREIMDKRKKRVEKVEDEIGKRVEEVLAHLNVPTKADIEALSEKIGSLAKMIEELKKKQA